MLASAYLLLEKPQKREGQKTKLLKQLESPSKKKIYPRSLFSPFTFLSIFLYNKYMLVPTFILFIFW
jgi:hypothetical protein